MDKIRVDVEDIWAASKVLGKINRMDLDDIAFYEGGKLMDFPSHLQEAFPLCGLSNVDFIRTSSYLEPHVFGPNAKLCKCRDCKDG